MAFRITYSVLNADLTELHKEFEATLNGMRQELGREYPSHVAGRELKSGKFLVDHNPVNTDEVLAKFHITPVDEIANAVAASKKAQYGWAHSPWQDRVKTMRKAADLISERRMRIAAIMCLETGKSRLEALGDVEESADLIRYYAGHVEETNGFTRPLGALQPNEKTKDVLKPFGVFAVIAPFNFPMALATGMSAAALLAGNSVILKPSQETPWCGEMLFECLRDAGLPTSVFQLVHGTGSELGKALLSAPGVDGIAFTGSKRVGMEIFHTFSKDTVKPCLMELGGKNACVVTPHADLEKAAEGITRSAFGMSGQKCSALSRVYAHESIKNELMEKVVAKARALKVSQPGDKDMFIGPVINRAAHDRYVQAANDAKKDGKVLLGAEDLRSKPEFSKGWYVAPTIVEVPHGHRLSRDELFLPFLTVHTYKDLPDALRMANDSEYGLTAGIFSEKKEDVDYFMDHIEAGVVYANRRTGATTGAWPGVQSFCGWKSSGSTGKGGCGPYYVMQFMREQSQTRME